MVVVAQEVVVVLSSWCCVLEVLILRNSLNSIEKVTMRALNQRC